MWTRDSRRITFASDRDGPMSIYWQPADGSGVAERLTTAEEGTEHWPESWSPDGRTLSFAVVKGIATSSIWTWSLDTKKSAVLIDESNGIQRLSTFSPDGKWLAYHSNEAGGFDVYVQPFPATGVKTRVTHDGRNTPVWSRRGELIYATTGSSTALFTRSISSAAGLAFGTEATLPVRGFLNLGTNGYRGYDISDDGDRLLMVFPADDSGGPSETRMQINVVLNWHEELKQRVPVQGQ